MSRIFVSYSHAAENRSGSPKWKRLLMEHLSTLSEQNLVDAWDDERIETGWRWLDQINQAIEGCSVAIVLLTPEALDSQFIVEQELTKLRRRFDSKEIVVIPLLCEVCRWTEHEWLSSLQLTPQENKPLDSMDAQQVEDQLQDLVSYISRTLSKNVVARLAKPDTAALLSAGQRPPADGNLNLYFHSAMPEPSEAEATNAMGRDKEFALLDLAFASSRVSIMSLIASGGVGKTALVRSWLSRCKQANWLGATRVFVWTFYSQGMREDRPASEDQFLAQALKWFEVPLEASMSASEKGQHLAREVLQQQTLIVLDGLEPLQLANGVRPGRLQAIGVASFLQTLLQTSETGRLGLCVVTTRKAVAELGDWETFHRVDHLPRAMRLDLSTLSQRAGAAVLHREGVAVSGARPLKSDDKDLRAASKEVTGHALTLVLLGRFLHHAHGGDIRRRDLVGFSEADSRIQGGHTFRMLAAFEKWFNRGGELGRRRICIVRMLGLFDRPISSGARDSLRGAPPIPGLTEQLFLADRGSYTEVPIGEEDWNETIASLASLGLLTVIRSGGSGDLYEEWIDCHPLIREHNANKLLKEAPETWAAAHSRLLDHLCKQFAAIKTHALSLTIEDMEPAFQAVFHGCAAGRHQEVYEHVFEAEIQRGSEHFARNAFGSFNSDYAALTCFLDPGRQPDKRLSETARSQLFVHAAFYLRVLGRLGESEEACIAGLEYSKQLGNWEAAARSAINLAEALMTAGDLTKAETYARESVDLAEASMDAFLRMYTRMGLGTVLHQRNAPPWPEALQQFAAAEQIQAARQPNQPLLYSHWGGQFNELLFDLGEDNKVLQRVRMTRRWARHGRSRWQALDAACHARALFRLRGKGERRLNRLRPHLSLAVDQVLLYGQEHEKPAALLARARLNLALGLIDLALSDVELAEQIAASGPMSLQLIDVRLLRLQASKRHSAMLGDRGYDHILQDVLMGIERHGYRRRLGELQSLQSGKI